MDVDVLQDPWQTHRCCGHPVNGLLVIAKNLFDLVGQVVVLHAQRGPERVALNINNAMLKQSLGNQCVFVTGRTLLILLMIKWSFEDELAQDHEAAVLVYSQQQLCTQMSQKVRECFCG